MRKQQQKLLAGVSLVIVVFLALTLVLPGIAFVLADDDDDDDDDDDVRDVFVGTWSSVDTSDLSNQYLLIKPGDHGLYRVSYQDDRASSCSTETVIPAPGYGGATAEGDVLTVDLVVWCLDDPPYFLVHWPFTATYDPDSDTLEQPSGGPWDPFIWTRSHGDMDED